MITKEQLKKFLNDNKTKIIARQYIEIFNSLPKSIRPDIAKALILANINFLDTMEEIPDGLFQGCEDIPTIEIPSNIKKIGAGAFSNSSIQKVVFSKNSAVTDIGIEAFKHCVNLTSIDIPNSVEQIGAKAFAECENLVDVHLPVNPNYTILENHLFAKDTNLEKINLSQYVSQIKANVFSTEASNLKILWDRVIDPATGKTKRKLSITDPAQASFLKGKVSANPNFVQPDN